MISRKDLAEQAFLIIKKDMGGEVKEKDIWKAIAEEDDYTLINFCEMKGSEASGI